MHSKHLTKYEHDHHYRDWTIYERLGCKSVTTRNPPVISENMAEDMEVVDPALDATDASEPDVVTLDKVTLLQESVDKMALSMFNALRLLPAASGESSTSEETVAAVRGLL